MIKLSDINQISSKITDLFKQSSIKFDSDEILYLNDHHVQIDYYLNSNIVASAIITTISNIIRWFTENTYPCLVLMNNNKIYSCSVQVYEDILHEEIIKKEFNIK